MINVENINELEYNKMIDQNQTASFGDSLNTSNEELVPIIVYHRNAQSRNEYIPGSETMRIHELNSISNQTTPDLYTKSTTGSLDRSNKGIFDSNGNESVKARVNQLYQMYSSLANQKSTTPTRRMEKQSHPASPLGIGRV